MKVLFMDDDHDFLEAQGAIFHREGYAVVPCATVIEAQHNLAIHGESVDVAVLDMDMKPDKEGGLTMANSIHAGYPSVSALVLTNHPETANASRCILQGICAYVIKTGGVDELELGLRYAHQQRVSRLKAQIERAVGAWWQTNAASAFQTLLAQSEKTIPPATIQHFRVMFAMANHWPMPGSATPTVPLSDLLPAAGEYGGVDLVIRESLDVLASVGVQSEVRNLPSMANVLMFLSHRGFGQKVEVTCLITPSRKRAILKFTGNGHLDDATASRFNKIAKGATLRSEDEVLAAIWVAQLSAFSGLCEMDISNNTKSIKITIPLVS